MFIKREIIFNPDKMNIDLLKFKIGLSSIQSVAEEQGGVPCERHGIITGGEQNEKKRKSIACSFGIGFCTCT